MITLQDIFKAVNALIKTKYPDIDVTDSDVKEGFKRPSFFTTVDEVSKTDYLHNFRRTMTLIVYYFPESRYSYKIDILEKIQGLEEIFNKSISVKDRVIHLVDDIESDIVDGVLTMRVDLEYYDTNEGGSEQLPLMENLEMS